MSGRLASFRGPSTPNSKPVQTQQDNIPSSPSRNTETTYHRKVRTVLQELRSVTQTWDDIVRIDGLKAATNLVDNRTELENILRLQPTDRQPRNRIVGPRLAIMEKRVNELDSFILKLKKQFAKLNSLVESLDETLYEAHKTKGWEWVIKEPLWCTWSLEKFVSAAAQLLPPYHRSLNMHIEHVKTLRSHSVSFEVSRDIIVQWTTRRHLEEGDWASYWEDLCSVEIERWNAK